MMLPLTATEKVKFTRLDDEVHEQNLDGVYCGNHVYFTHSMDGASADQVERPLGKARVDYLDQRLESGDERSRFSWWYLSDVRLLDLAQPYEIVQRIRETDYTSPESTKRLSRFFERFGRAARARLCPVALGLFGEQDYYFYPQSHMIHLLEGRAVTRLGEHQADNDDVHFLELADPSYFCIGRCNLKDGHERRNPGVWLFPVRCHLPSEMPCTN